MQSTVGLIKFVLNGIIQNINISLKIKSNEINYKTEVNIGVLSIIFFVLMKRLLFSQYYNAFCTYVHNRYIVV